MTAVAEMAGQSFDPSARNYLDVFGSDVYVLPKRLGGAPWVASHASAKPQLSLMQATLCDFDPDWNSLLAFFHRTHGHGCCLD